MKQDPQNLEGMVGGGLKKVAPVIIAAVVMIIGVLVALPDPTTTSKDFKATDIALTAVRGLPDGGKATAAQVAVRSGDTIRLAANVPFPGTVMVYRVGDVDDDRVWPVDSSEAVTTSAGKVVELGDVAASGDAGVQTWLLSLCPFDAPGRACIVRAGKTLCPDGCLTTTLQATIVP
jgi:hypothetical protein